MATLKFLLLLAVMPFQTNPPRILVADDHTIVRIGMKHIIGQLDYRICVDEASDGASVIAKLRSGHFDLLILDINMPDTESFSLSAYLLKEFPAVRIIIFTMSQEPPFAIRFLKQGVHGYLLKESGEEEIRSALRAVMRGNVYVGDWLAQAISRQQITPAAKTPFDTLSNRELEVALQILQGNTMRKIAETLHLNRSTIGTHKSRVMSKLCVSSTLELMNLARAYGLIE